MSKSVRFFSALLVPAFVLAGAVASPTFAQEKGKATMKVLIDNNKVKVWETTYKPGDVNKEVQSSHYRVNRTLQGGTIERTYADGKKEKLELKAGVVRMLEPSKPGAPTYTVQNIGKTDYVSYTVLLKQ